MRLTSVPQRGDVSNTVTQIEMDVDITNLVITAADDLGLIGLAFAALGLLTQSRLIDRNSQTHRPPDQRP
jgi:hypothetical protein